MSDTGAVVWNDGYLAYDLGGNHPMHPVRLDLTMSLAASLGVLEHATVVSPEPAGEEALERVHSADYVAAVRAASTDPGYVGYGMGTPDDPVFHAMHTSAALIAGGSISAAELVLTGRATHAVNIAGGLHHAMRRSASGFCVYNDAALAIAHLLAAGAERVAYVDVDVHHGDGVQAAFYADPRVLTISLHQDGHTLFPGTGFAGETGAPGAEGTAVNVALPPGTGDLGWLRAFDAVVPSLVRAFGPTVLVTQCGCDSYREDPLADLTLSVDGQRASYARLHALAHECAAGRWVALGGGGYSLLRGVPRAWTHLLAEVCGYHLDPGTPTPQRWRAEARRRLPGGTPPETMTDGAGDDLATLRPWQPGDGDWVDAAISATRAAVFPYYGLDPRDPRD